MKSLTPRNKCLQRWDQIAYFAYSRPNGRHLERQRRDEHELLPTTAEIRCELHRRWRRWRRFRRTVNRRSASVASTKRRVGIVFALSSCDLTRQIWRGQSSSVEKLNQSLSKDLNYLLPKTFLASKFRRTVKAKTFFRNLFRICHYKSSHKELNVKAYVFQHT